MARKNNKKKYKRQHAEALRADKLKFAKFEKKFKEVIEERNEAAKELEKKGTEEEILGNENRSGMVIEPIKRKKRIRKNKMFQKRSVKLEKKKNRKLRTAPILVRREDRMDFE